MNNYKFGKVYWVNLNPQKFNEIGKIRPCVIVSNESINKFSNFLIVCPISLKFKDEKYLLNEEMILSNKSRVIIYLIRSIHKKRVKEFAYNLLKEEIVILKTKLRFLTG